MSKPREIFLYLDSAVEYKDFGPMKVKELGDRQIHLIEYSAYQALERKLEVAKRALEFYTEEVNISIQIKDNGRFYMEECNDISSDCSFGATARQALAEIKGE